MSRNFEHISDAQAYIDNVERVSLPERATTGSAGYDILSTEDFTLMPGEDILIPTGLKAYMQPDEFLMVLPRSGHGFKFYVRLANTAGIIDSDYYGNSKNEGHIWIKIRNESSENLIKRVINKILNRDKKTLVVKRGEAVCQGIFQKFLLTENDNSHATREGGFGSTGK